jgi:hypothetical protein
VAAIVTVATIGTAGLSVVDGLAWHERSVSQRLPAEDVEVVDIDLDMFAVRLSHGPLNEVVIKGELSSGVQQPKLTTTVRDGTLRISARCSIDVVDPGFCTGELRIAMPAGLPISIRTDLGDVRGEQLSVPSFRSTSDLGDVDVSWARPPGRVEVRTGTGQVRLDLPDVAEGYAVTTSTPGGVAKVEVPVSELSSHSVSASSDTGDVVVD